MDPVLVFDMDFSDVFSGHDNSLFSLITLFSFMQNFSDKEPFFAPFQYEGSLVKKITYPFSIFFSSFSCCSLSTSLKKSYLPKFCAPCSDNLYFSF